MLLLWRSNHFSMTNRAVSLRRERLSVRIQSVSVVEIESVTDRNVTVNGIDVVDQTPLLDIKPFVPKFDVPSDTDTGWLTASKSTIQSKQADERFVR